MGGWRSARHRAGRVRDGDGVKFAGVCRYRGRVACGRHSLEKPIQSLRQLRTADGVSSFADPGANLAGARALPVVPLDESILFSRAAASLRLPMRGLIDDEILGRAVEP